MKKTVKAICVLICLMIVSLGVATAQAADSAKPTDENSLLQSALQFKRQLTTPAGGAEQKALLAVTLAASKAGVNDATEILNVYKRALDSITHLLITDSSFVWSGTQWIKRTRTSHTYGPEYLQTGESTQIWDGEWLDSTRLMTTYDGTGRILTSTTQDWKDTGWQNMDKATYTYDDIDMTIEVVWQHWRDNSGWDWVDTLRTTSLLTDGLLSTATTEEWDGLEWVYLQLLTYTYDTSDILTQILGQTWSGAAWVNSDRTTITYNALDQDTSDLVQTWTGSWTNVTRTQHAYDGQGNPILGVLWTWGGAAYTKTYADTLKHNSGQFVEAVRYIVAADSLERTQYSYDPAYDFILQEVYQYYNGSWVNVRKAGYYWEQVLVVGIDDENGQLPSAFSLAQNYPNPFNPTTVIRYSLAQRAQVSIGVFNILGQEVTKLVDEAQLAGAYEATWNGTDRSGQNVGSGIYFYRITVGDISQTRKMVLLK